MLKIDDSALVRDESKLLQALPEYRWEKFTMASAGIVVMMRERRNDRSDPTIYQAADTGKRYVYFLDQLFVIRKP